MTSMQRRQFLRVAGVLAAAGIVEGQWHRFAYRRFDKKQGIPLVFNIHVLGNLDSWDSAVLHPSESFDIRFFSFVTSDIGFPSFDSCGTVQILLPQYGGPKMGALS